MVAKLEEQMNRHDSALYLHLQRTGLKFLWFAFKWMNCFLIRELPLGCIIRMWDTYFSEDNNGFEDFHVYVCATLLQHFSETLKGMDFDNSFEYIQVSYYCLMYKKIILLLLISCFLPTELTNSRMGKSRCR